MNTATTRTSLRFWAPTGLAGTAATAAVALLMSAVATAPAYSQQRSEPGSAAYSNGERTAAPVYCFMGRPTAHPELRFIRPCGR